MENNTNVAVSEDTDVEALEKDLETLRAESETLRKDLYHNKETCLRTAADFQNYRKRVTQETERRSAAQKEAFILELLPVIDNLERALESASTSSEKLQEGVQMILQQLRQLLQQHGISSEETTGQPFDPHYHEAIATLHDPSQPDQVILETSQRGYRRDNEVLRPAKVVVNDHSRQDSVNSE